MHKYNICIIPQNSFKSRALSGARKHSAFQQANPELTDAPAQNTVKCKVKQ